MKPEAAHPKPAGRMKIAHSSFFILHSPLGLALLLAAGVPVSAAPTKATTPAPTGTTNPRPAAADGVGAPAEMPITRSHFGSLLENGKDPFYPNSVRIQRKPEVAQTNQVVAVAPEVRINGFSGNTARPLVIINNITFGEGDEQTVKTAAGSAQVRCLEIRMQDQAVEIEINGQRREIKFLGRK